MDLLRMFQTFLDDVTIAVMAGDFDTFAAHVSLPFHLVTESARLVVTTEADLRAGFDDFQQTLKVQHVTDMIRLAESAAFLSEDQISGRYVTHLLANGHRAVPPFSSQMELRREAGIWRTASISNSLYNHRWPLMVPEVKHGTDGTRM